MSPYVPILGVLFFSAALLGVMVLASLVIGPGAHRLDIDFGLAPGVVREAPEVRCLLEGADDFWHPAARGMMLICEVLDAEKSVLSRASFRLVRRATVPSMSKAPSDTSCICRGVGLKKSPFRTLGAFHSEAAIRLGVALN